MLLPGCSHLGVVPLHLGSEDPLPHSKASGYAVIGDVLPGHCGYSHTLLFPFADIPEMQERVAAG